MVLAVCSSILALVIVILFIYIVLLKKQMKNIKNELGQTREKSYNRQLQIALLDSDLENLAAEINENLDYQKHLKLAEEQKELNLRQSISDIAHDLRTPLTVIKGNLQMLEQNDRLTEQDRKYLAICKDKADVLKIMVDDFFEMSVLESDSTKVELKEVDITNLLVQFVVDHEALIRQHHLEPDICLPDRSIKIYADEQMLLRMLSNLLNNVIKYAKHSFGLKMEPIKQNGKEMCQITFKNEISQSEDLDVKHLFDRTYRGNQARQGSGAGLGLYIVKLLAKKQNAEVFAAQEKDELIIGIRLSIMDNEKKVQ